MDEEQEKKTEAVHIFVDDNKSASNCIIDINHLHKILKKETHCQSCAKKSAINIIWNVVDEYSDYLKQTRDINIPDHIKRKFKEESKTLLMSEASSVHEITVDVKNCGGIASKIEIKCQRRHCLPKVEPRTTCFHEKKKKRKEQNECIWS